jgi:hypothetical protein
MNNFTQEDKDALETCIDFLNRIGIETTFRKIDTTSFLPGLLIENGNIVIDTDALTYPGDILHEAGHIAVSPGETRSTLNPESIIKSTNRESEEMMAIAWSYAACIYLSLDPYFVFHDHGYKGGGSNIVENFEEKRYIGVPMLQWVGLTADEKRAIKLKVSPYPHMIKWMRD